MSTTGNTPTTWRNWSGSQAVRGIKTITPRSTQELAQIIKTAKPGATFKPLGSGHSFSGVGRPQDTAIDMSGFEGLIHADAQKMQISIGAGTKLWQLPAILSAHGMAMENLGDINRQTLSGATSTGTHGTGRHFGGISTQIAGLTLVTGTGEILRVDAENNAELLPFVRVGLGALGVITEITVQCVPAYVLQAEEYAASLDDVRANWDELFTTNDHYEFHWFPTTARAVTKTNTRKPVGTPLSPRSKVGTWFNEELLANTAFRGMCELGRAVPKTVAKFNHMATSGMARHSFTESSADVFATSRKVRFHEMEYAVPFEQLRDTFDEVRQLIDSWNDPVEFPVEVRVAAADDIALSTAYGRDTGYIAVHRYHRKEYQKYFHAVEEIMMAHQGRPHWGKMHTRDADYLREVYPRFDEFLAVRDRLDPQRRFANPYLTEVLGA